MPRPLQTAEAFDANSGGFDREAPRDFVGEKGEAYREQGGPVARR
jgi:hypothetical protein